MEKLIKRRTLIQSKLSFKLYELSQMIIANKHLEKQILFNKIFQSFKNNDFIINNSQKIYKIQKDTLVVFTVQFKKGLRFLKKMNVIFKLFSVNEIQLRIDAFCQDRIFDNKYYIPIEKILNESNKKFYNLKIGKLQLQIINYLSDLFNRFNKIYQKEIQEGRINDQAANAVYNNA